VSTTNATSGTNKPLGSLGAAWSKKLADLPRSSTERWTVLLSVLGIGVFILGRYLGATHENLTRWIVAGGEFVSRPGAPRWLYIYPHVTGYDGQFYWRLAASPLHLGVSRYLGVRLDAGFRSNRIFYPALSWLVAGGSVSNVSWSMIAVNALSLVALVVLALWVLRATNLPAFYALSVLLVPGLVGALSRDLTEVLTALSVVAGVLFMRYEKWVLATLAWSAALLTRETTAVLLAVYATFALLAIVRRQRSVRFSDLSWLIPYVVFGTWQLVVHSVTGHFPLISSSGSGDVGLPFVGLVSSIPHWFTPASSHQLVKGVLYVVQFVAVVVVLYAAWRNRRRVASVEFVVLAVAVALVICETANGWRSPFDDRYATVPMALAWFQLLQVREARLLRRTASYVAPVVALTALWRMVVV
jgi:hypothetical protein